MVGQPAESQYSGGINASLLLSSFIRQTQTPAAVTNCAVFSEAVSSAYSLSLTDTSPGCTFWRVVERAVLEQVFTVPLGSAGAGVPLGSAEQVFAGHLGSAGTGFHWSSGQCWSGVRWSSGRAGACCLFTSHLGSAGESCSLVIWAVLEQVICSLVIRQR